MTGADASSRLPHLDAPSRIPPSRIRFAHEAPVVPDREHVLYWMISARRLEWNFALDRALEWCEELRLPLLIFEPLRLGYRWASVRHHRFCLDGMAEHQARLKRGPVGYFPYVEPAEGEGKGLLEALAARAAVVVTDDFPAFFLPGMVRAAGPRLSARLEVVDSNGIVPLALPGREFTTAYSFRRYLHRALPPLLEEAPAAQPLPHPGLPPFPGIPEEILRRWPPVTDALLQPENRELAELPLDREVGSVQTRGGYSPASERLGSFLEHSIGRYREARNHPDEEVTTGLSPYLHWGHISAHEVVHGLLEKESWNPGKLGQVPLGKREGWWGLSPGAEAFLDQIITWRELGYNTAHRRADAERFESLPDWAKATLEEHADDPRPREYGLKEFEAAQTHDGLWNAAQRQLREEGVIHTYLRMLWGKKILEWSASPRDALEIMLQLNNRWALDGRDPNSTSGIFWVLGRYDRGWPERPVYGTVRSMSSENTMRKVMLTKYMDRFTSSDLWIPGLLS